MDILYISNKVCLVLKPQDEIDNKSTFVQLFVSCHSHPLSPCCPRSMSPYNVTWPLWVNIKHWSAALLRTKYHTVWAVEYQPDFSTSLCHKHKTVFTDQLLYVNMYAGKIYAIEKRKCFLMIVWFAKRLKQIAECKISSIAACPFS